MSVEALRKKKILGKDPEADTNEFLRRHVPTFTAPTDAKKWAREIPKLQKAALERVYLKGVPDSIINARPRVVWGETLRPDKSYVIRKLRYEAYPNYWIPALLYEPTKLRGKVPVVINPNGHHRGGKATTYKQTRCANIARRGMIAMSTEFIGMSDLEADCNHNNIAHLDLTGMAGVALFYLNLKKGLDVLLAHKHADRKRVCCTGLSGGGWQTIVISALDPRVTVSVPVAGYTTHRTRIGCFREIGDMEQTPVDQTTVADYDVLTAMLAPRPALLILNEFDDCCFATPQTRPVIYDAVKPTYEAFGALDRFQTHSNKDPGTHNYGPDNRTQFYKFVKKHFALPEDTPTVDIHREDELLTEDELRVGLPPEQETMLSIARNRAIELEKKLRTPTTAAQKRALRKRLIESIKLPRNLEAKAEVIQTTRGGENVKLRVDGWTVPITWERAKDGEPAVLAMSDGGRAAGMPVPLPEPGHRCWAEMVGTGESRESSRAFMMINITGHRLLGIQTAQVLAAARYAAERSGTSKVHAVGDGYNCSFVLMVAAAIEPGLFASVTTYAPVPKLRYLMEWPLRYEEAQSVLHPGLLEVVDTPQIRALMEGVEYRQPGREVVHDRR